MAYQPTWQSKKVPCTHSFVAADKDKAYEITCPEGAKRLLLELQTNTGLFAYSGTAGSDLGTSAHSLAADAVSEWRLSGSPQTVYVQVDTNTTTVVLSFLAE